MGVCVLDSLRLTWLRVDPAEVLYHLHSVPLQIDGLNVFLTNSKDDKKRVRRINDWSVLTSTEGPPSYFCRYVVVKPGLGSVPKQAIKRQTQSSRGAEIDKTARQKPDEDCGDDDSEEWRQLKISLERTVITQTHRTKPRTFRSKIKTLINFNPRGSRTSASLRSCRFPARPSSTSIHHATEGYPLLLGHPG